MVTRDYSTVSKTITISATSGGASGNVLYTAPNKFDTEIDFLSITNGNSSAKNATVEWYDSSSNTYNTILNDKSIAGNDTYDVVTNVFHLHAGDKIVCHGPSGSGCQVTLSGKEYFNLTR
tara:strand:+ start:211 stop:570 length:360 start_codon:yes stop_codon:yes gene_type:complete